MPRYLESFARLAGAYCANRLLACAGPELLEGARRWRATMQALGRPCVLWGGHVDPGDALPAGHGDAGPGEARLAPYPGDAGPGEAIPAPSS
eukprot:4321136-Alexandrium_andersonii.AAC.1